MSNSHTANQPPDRPRIKHISHHPVRLALVETPFRPTSDNTASILSAVLQEGKALADFGGGIDVGIVQEETEYAAHWGEGGEGTY